MGGGGLQVSPFLSLSWPQGRFRRGSGVMPTPVSLPALGRRVGWGVGSWLLTQYAPEIPPYWGGVRQSVMMDVG